MLPTPPTVEKEGEETRVCARDESHKEKYKKRKAMAKKTLGTAFQEADFERAYRAFDKGIDTSKDPVLDAMVNMYMDAWLGFQPGEVKAIIDVQKENPRIMEELIVHRTDTE